MPIFPRPCALPLAALLLLGACGDESGDDGGGGGTLGGTVGGDDWTVSAAYTDSFLSNDDVYYVVLLGNGDDASCAEPIGVGTTLTAAKLEIRIPTTTGSYDLSAADNRELNVWSPGGLNVSIDTGTVELVEASTTELSGALSVSTADVELDGSFTAEICPD